MDSGGGAVAPSISASLGDSCRDRCDSGIRFGEGRAAGVAESREAYSITCLLPRACPVDPLSRVAALLPWVVACPH